MLTLEEINRASTAEAARLLAPFIERAPALAEKVARGRPFASIEDLRAALHRELLGLSEAACVALFNAHPELAPEKPGDMTSASQSEQARLGLTSDANSHRAQLADMNARYRDRFGFPFITALARHSDMDSVLAEFRSRMTRDRHSEIRTTIDQILAVSTARISAGLIHPGGTLSPAIEAGP